MHKKLVVSFAVLSALTVVVAANNYKLDLYQTTVMNGTTFKPGECKLEIKDNQVILKQGKTTAEAAVKVENSPNKYFSTSVGYSEGGRIQEIRLGGTTTKVVFEREGDRAAR